MIKLSISIASQILYRPVTVTVALPYTLTTGKGPFKTLYALHPAMENSGIYFEKLGLSDKVDKDELAIVAPDLGNGYFINTPYEKQADFLQKELMPVLCEMLPLSSRREHAARNFHGCFRCGPLGIVLSGTFWCCSPDFRCV